MHALFDGEGGAEHAKLANTFMITTVESGHNSGRSYYLQVHAFAGMIAMRLLAI